MLRPNTPKAEFDSSLLLPNVLQAHAESHPYKSALILDDTIVTWADMVTDINRIANAIIDHGVKRGQRVALLGRNSIVYSELYCGVVTAGVSCVPLSTMINADTLLLMLEDSQAKMLFITKEFVPLLEQIMDRIPDLKNSIVTIDHMDPRWINYEKLIGSAATGHPAVDIDLDDEFNVIYSSGTTGTPKGIVHTHRIRYAMVGKLHESGEFDINLVSTPLYSNTTIVCWLPTLYSGGLNVIMPRFNAEKCLQLIEQHKVRVAMFVPVQYDRMLLLENFDEYDLSSMHAKFSTSAPLRAHVKRELLDRFPGSLTEFYGLTEGGPGAVLNATENPDRLDSVGQVGEGSVLLVIDEEGKVLGPNKIGEFVGRSPNMSLGYLNKEEATKSMFWYDDEGLLYYKSGDTGYIDDDGFVYLLDRKKDMIISGGFNIYATDLELALLAQPEVHDVAVIGVPSDQWGETPVAFVILKKGSNMDSELLRATVNEKLNKFQRISKIELVKDLPKSPIGKVLKRQLRDEWMG